MLLEKYRPKTIAEVLGNAKNIAEIKSWLARWKQGESLIVHGQPGCGKSLCIQLIAAEGGYELVESHASDARGYKDLKSSLMISGAQQSLFYKKKLICIDELELVDSVKGVLEIIGESQHPVILVASDPYEPKLSQLRKRCGLAKFGKIPSNVIAGFIKLVCRKEAIQLTDAEISQLAKICNGDIRAALIDAEFAANIKDIYRDKEENVFETLKILLKTTSLANSRYAVNTSEKTPEELLLWLEENIYREYENTEEIAKAYDWLSKADMLAARIIKRQSWSLQKYYADCLCGISLAKRCAYSKFTPYAFPRLKSTKSFDSVAEKLSKKLHVSKKESLQYLRLVSLLGSKAASMGLTEEELESLAAIRKPEL